MEVDVDGEIQYQDYFHYDDSYYDYEFIKYHYIENEQVLVECDYCGDMFYMNKNSRGTRISSFKKLSKEFGYEELYKDACKNCSNKKRMETMMIRHGTHSMFTKESVKLKSKKAMLKQNGVKVSRQQKHISNLINGRLNALIGFYAVDILLPNKVIIEYDGSGHDLSVKMGTQTQEQFDKSERGREKYLLNKGFSILRIVSQNDLLPSNKVLLNLINDNINELNNNVKYIHIPKYKRDKRYGKLYYIEELAKKGVK